MIIYKIENNINGKIYIGLTTKGLGKRIAQHVIENKSHVQRALNKYGLQSFTISVIDEADSKEILCEKEQYWIKFYDCKSPKGYNLTDGGDGLINPSKSVRKRISKTLKKKHIVTTGFSGRNHSEESKRKISVSMKKVFESTNLGKKISKANKGKKRSEEFKRALSLARKGVPRGKEFCELMTKINRERVLAPGYVNSMKGKKRPDLSERNKLGKGRKLSVETRAKMSQASKGKPKTAEHVLHIKQAKTLNRRANQKGDCYG